MYVFFSTNFTRKIFTQCIMLIYNMLKLILKINTNIKTKFYLTKIICKHGYRIILILLFAY